MFGSAVGRVVLHGVFDVLAKRDSSIDAVTWLLGGISVRFFVAHALAAEAFMVAYPRLPTVRRRLEGEKGTLIVGAALGTVMWVVLRALLPIPGPVPIGATVASWLTMALFSGPLIVWIARQHLAMDDVAPGIGRGLAVILPSIFAEIWLFGTNEGNGMGVLIVFVGFAALVLMLVGFVMLLRGTRKARRHA